MRRFVYAPAVSAYVSTEFGFVDLSDDIISGTVTRRVNAVSSASLVLQNPNRKYLKKIKPMDRIVIYLKRIHQPVLVFSGYVDRAPYDQLYPQPVSLTASCTLKRLLHTYWDPGLPFVQQWLAQYGWEYDTGTGTMVDPARNLYNLDYSGGLGHLLRAVMNDVGGWSIGNPGQTRDTVHVMALPKSFIDRTKSLLKNEVKVAERNQEMIDRILTNLLSSDGVATSTTGTNTDNITLTDNVRDTDPLPKDMANRHYNAKIFGEAVYVGNGPGGQYRAMAQKAADKYNVDTAVFFGLIQQESGWGHVNDVNASGAIGLTQVVPPKYNHNAGDILGDPELQLDIGAHYLSDQFRAFKSWELALAAYNAGPGAVIKYGGIPPFSQTQKYVPAVMKYADEERKVLAAAKQKGGKIKGNIGDVKTSNMQFFTKVRTITSDQKGQFDTSLQGRTFHIKNNPFQDNSLIFRAIFDSAVSDQTLRIYVPGADNKGTPWAANWKDKQVSLETSAGGEPFTGQQTKNSASGSASFMYPIQPYPGFSHSVSPQGNFGNYRGNSSLGPHYHAGIDIPANEGTGLVACVGGTVVANQNDAGGGGNYVVIKDAKSNHTFTYMHMNAPSPIAVGKQVKQGQIIGHVGHTGDANGFNHLHFEYHPNGGASASNLYGYSTAADPAPMCSSAWQSGNKVATGDIASASSAANAYAATGVQANQQVLGQIAASTQFGATLGFPVITDTIESINLTGARALANDVPLFKWIEFICKASGRNFQSMPNGDFLAFYPDHFNWSGTAPYFRISPIETIDLSVDISDEELTTHVFTTGDIFQNNTVDFFDKISSSVASVEQADFRKLVNVGEKFKPYDFLRRYGARPWQEDRPEIKHSLLQFMYGWMTFLDKWAKQFYCQAEFAFLPELFPGGTIDFPPPIDLKFYVEDVTHTFDRTGGFSTTASLISPSTSGKGGHNPAMVLADGGLSNNPPR